MSYAMWMRLGTQPLSGLTYVFGVPISFGFRLFSGSSGFLFTAGWQGTASSLPNITSRTNVVNLARNGWVHVALVVDATSLLATYYINGVAETPFTITAGASFSGPQFFVGRQTSTSSYNLFDLDEFLLVNYALTPAEVAVLAGASLAGDSAYAGAGCTGMRLSSTGGRPRLGNAGYGLVLDSQNPVAYALGFGSNRCSLGALPLPFDLGTVYPHLVGCNLESSLSLFFVTGFKPGGPQTIPLPIPAGGADLQGATMYGQTLGLDPATTLLTVSNAFALSLGN